jgi:uncharacterized membrane protein YccC
LAATKQLASTDKRYSRIPKKPSATVINRTQSRDQYDISEDSAISDRLRSQIESKDRTIQELSSEVRDLSNLSATLERQIAQYQRVQQQSDIFSNSRVDPLLPNERPPEPNSAPSSAPLMSLDQRKPNARRRYRVIRWVVFVAIVAMTVNLMWTSRRRIASIIKAILRHIHR